MFSHISIYHHLILDTIISVPVQVIKLYNKEFYNKTLQRQKFKFPTKIF